MFHHVFLITVSQQVSLEFLGAFVKGVHYPCYYLLSPKNPYAAIENSSLISPFRTPNSNTKLQGYADDTNLILSDDQSIIEALKLVKSFETATGASLNIKKTKIFGIGQWKRRTIWPISNVLIQIDCMSVLGIKFCNEFEESVNICWSEALTRISNKIATMHNRNLTLFQRSVLVNSLLTSQIWYYAQTYPLPLYWSKKINVLLYKFIWITNSEPIARSTLNLDRDMGGLSVINILVKSESIFAYRMLKQFMDDENQLSLVTYFNSLRVNPMLNIRTLPINVAYVNTSYYNKGITTIRKCMRLNSFPNISSRIIYSHLLVKQMPKIQEQYPLYNWKHIWGNLQFKFIPINTREVMFKYLHEILPNKCRLK